MVKRPAGSEGVSRRVWTVASPVRVEYSTTSVAVELRSVLNELETLIGLTVCAFAY